ncbi:MAG: UBP-type zinc finger domain-containing protein [Actinomycetota bacterium]|jgi:hypothetical protein|nr:UBP-type zinc finger domain-containing protein [Euzebyaceae bacterium]MDQ3453345.1 UBP-type zinc finger domain-containing protein [Actinomycetota bacterium]
MAVCEHLVEIREVRPSTTQGCTECLAIGGQWVHLRECLSCGHVGCCDSSPNRHASAHFAASHHPIIQSFEPGYFKSLVFALIGLQLRGVVEGIDTGLGALLTTGSP